jgi:phenylalanyl-tRNA synthetase beta chain
MQVSLKWIDELVRIESVNLDDLIDKLTLGGFEVEEILKRKIDNENQLILDISATANRSDSLSIQGISAEISSLLKKPVKISHYSSKLLNWKKKTDKFSHIISRQDNCSNFVAIIIENINKVKVPKWIKQKLISSGLTVTDSLLDFENYILLETGYTFAFYDFSKICEKLDSSNVTFSLSNGNEGETFIGNNDIKYMVNSSTKLLKANGLPISIAGVIPHKNYSCSSSTNSLLIEASIFDAAKIRQQSRYLGLRTERSARYEKSLKNKYLIEALYRLISLLRISNPNLICKLHTIAQTAKQEFKAIHLNYQTVNKILGPIEKKNNQKYYIPPETITEYLTRLNFEFLYNPLELTWEVQVPELRNDDITREIDLVEEIGRLHGFNNFLTTLPNINTIGNEDLSYKTRKKITSSLIKLGFNELIHYSLVNETTFLKNNIKLINPLLVDCSNLRSSLLPNLIQTVQENLKRGNSMLEGFEYGHIFLSDTINSFQEKDCVAGIFGGIKKKLTWSDTEQSLTWFEGKGKIEQFFKELNISISWKMATSNNSKIFHPYRTATVYLANGIELGLFGQIHPILASQLGISSEIYLFEFEIAPIEQQIQNNKLIRYQKYSLYPKIIKDLSFIIKDDINFQEIQTFLHINGTQFLCEINLLDEYVGKSIPDKHKSICLQLTFQSNETTLENKKIEAIVNNLQLILINKFHAIIRN